MVVTIFRNKFRANADMDAYAAVSRRMHELVKKHPGFVSIESFEGVDGEEISIERFADEESLLAWRNNPEHKEAQRRGKEEFCAEYSYETCIVIRKSKGFSS